MVVERCADEKVAQPVAVDIACSRHAPAGFVASPLKTSVREADGPGFANEGRVGYSHRGIRSPPAGFVFVPSQE